MATTITSLQIGLVVVVIAAALVSGVFFTASSSLTGGTTTTADATAEPHAVADDNNHMLLTARPPLPQTWKKFLHMQDRNRDIKSFSDKDIQSLQNDIGEAFGGMASSQN